MFDEFFSKAQELRAQGQPFATATVVRAEKPTSGKPGDKAIVTLGGVMVGWIGGSCAQPTVVREAIKAIADDRSRLIRLSPNPEKERTEEGIEVLPMTCYSGGTLDIYIEPQQPQPRLLIVGNLPVAQALAHLGKAMNHHVVAVDPEADSAGGGAMSHASLVLRRLDEMSDQITPLTFVVVATHGTNDEPAVDVALRAGASYVGLVASPKRAEAVRKYLRLTGLKEEELAPLEAPAGLDIGARRGDEIALSIMAEIVQRRRSAERLEWPAEEAEGGSKAASTAIDPICGMTVVIEGAPHTHEHEGVTYYFCCAGCRQRFASEPARA